jgi:predicted ATPase
VDAEALPSLSPEAWKRRLQGVCQQLIVSQAAEQPLCLLIEDGHWLDGSSQELLDLLVLSLVSQPILLLVHGSARLSAHLGRPHPLPSAHRGTPR